jgi:hypothetical protein
VQKFNYQKGTFFGCRVFDTPGCSFISMVIHAYVRMEVEFLSPNSTTICMPEFFVFSDYICLSSSLYGLIV